MILAQPKRLFYLFLVVASTLFILYVLVAMLRSVGGDLVEVSPTWKAYTLNLLFLQFLTIVLAWIGFAQVGGLIGLILSSTVACFLALVLHDSHLSFFVLYYLVLFALLFFYEKNRSAEVIIHELECEKLGERKNSLSIELHEKTNVLSAFYEKYSNYFNLREVAQDFSTTLSLEKVCELTIDKAASFIPKADAYLLYLVDLKENALSLTASRCLDPTKKFFEKQGDIYDVWVLKNRQHLIVQDTAKDFRFDTSQQNLEVLKSLIIAPVVNEGRIIGLLRLNSSQKEWFAIDDLRLLDIISVLAATVIRNAQLYQQTNELAIHDSLTKLFVQRHFKQRLREEHQRALLSHDSLSLLMCDIDHFKNYNDRYGHAAGDLILVQIADVLRRSVQDTAIQARYGGEEFALILPKTNFKEAREIAERIRKTIETQPFLLRQEETHVTVSIGVASIPEDTLDEEELIKKADGRLYEAKRKGRNKVC